MKSRVWAKYTSAISNKTIQYPKLFSSTDHFVINLCTPFSRYCCNSITLFVMHKQIKLIKYFYKKMHVCMYTKYAYTCYKFRIKSTVF